MTARSFVLFDTPIGTCGLVWAPTGICGLQLPEKTPAATRTRLRRRWPEAEETAPPPDVQTVIDRVVTLLKGEPIDLSDVRLDLDAVPPFHRRVYEVARAIPPGQTMTYGEIARRLDAPHESREVGQALGRNPIAIIVPCHRVLAADGRMGGFSASGGVATKRRILEIEGAAALGAGPLFERLGRPGG
ncbi:methylated-DNA-[protein]-cysteine S-methyltransferase [Enhydrobacter aerosaccus]|uniref:methylated-DNA--[protein]-cysteine S-methyltransferase n=1 Tax=Enhydrobacter aerosaccus TaxID=225324 RepID=A0A1T4S755_9HYPH|nr:methylated-DNA--[protein]-cysteine S-methyltransferase [Enhydrobacter aerosaccus]SKA24012.1 methylated-DNA-[protein]-cysteine S-methyltransferase [Enhydrobacter aerosaccus]